MAKDKAMSALDKAVLQAMGENRTFGLEDDPAKTTLPELWTCMSTVYVGRDRIKTPMTMGIQLVPGGVQIRLTDKDMKLSLGCIVPHLDGALQSLEHVLSLPNPPWVAWGKGEPELRKRKSRN